MVSLSNQGFTRKIPLNLGIKYISRKYSEAADRPPSKQPLGMPPSPTVCRQILENAGGGFCMVRKSLKAGELLERSLKTRELANHHF
jgi:hypothetical protein